MNPFHLDLFSGIGGFALAAQRAGFETVAFCEIDEYAQQILIKNFGAVVADAASARCQAQRNRKRGQGSGFTLRVRPTIFPDITQLDGTQYAGIDLLTGGFPCQPFSLAGKRRGAADDRAIWPEMRRIIAEARPRWVLGENVPGIIGMELDNYLSDLESLGYSAWPIVIPACAVDARHRRDRVWIVAHSGGGRREPGSAGRAGEISSRPRNEFSLSSQDACAISDSQRPRLEERQEQSARKECQAVERSGDVVSNSDKSLRGHGNHDDEALFWTATAIRENGSAIRCESRRQPQSQLRRVADGLPKRLDSPARWPDEDPETPRIATGIPNRIDRLKCLGNAIVPQVAELILRQIAQLL